VRDSETDSGRDSFFLRIDFYAYIVGFYVGLASTKENSENSPILICST